MKSVIRHISLYLNILVALLLLLSCLSVYIRPERLWIFAFFGLAFPWLFIINLGFVLYWMLMRRTALLISLSIVLFAATFLGRVIRWPGSFGNDSVKKSQQPGPVPDTLKVLSYNVRAFNLYNWAHDKMASRAMLKFIASAEADIICFQEFYSQAEKKLSLKEIPGNPDIAPHAYLHYYFVDKKGGRYGIATYSRYPIIRRGALTFDKTFNVCIYTDILRNGDTIRVYNNHLQSVRFRKGNYDFIDTIRFSYGEKQMSEIKDISARLKKAYILRSRQVDLIAAHIRQCPYPVIVCGDFNDTPISYTYQQMSRGLLDSYMEAGHGTGTTYFGKIPSFRIDYIFHSQDFEAVNFETIPISYSDHYPIMARLINRN